MIEFKYKIQEIMSNLGYDINNKYHLKAFISYCKDKTNENPMVIKNWIKGINTPSYDRANVFLNKIK